MSLKTLQRQIERKQAKIAVIGLGYVGLPVAASFAKAGYDVLGIDLLTDRVAVINAGDSPIEGNEPGLEELIAEVVENGQLQASVDYTQLEDRDVILIAVETPVDENNKPRYEALQSSLQNLGPVLKQGSLVIIESTVSPGTTEDFVRPTLENSTGVAVSEGFFLGNCPERVMPGKLLFNLRTLSRVVGGMTPETAETMISLYRHIGKGDLEPTDCTTAELVKTVENTYRDVQIAFANEIAIISEAAGGDVWKVSELIKKISDREMLLPGAGVGGHCIPKDPWLLAHGANGKDVPLRIIPAAREVNNSMPAHVANLLKETLMQVGQTLKGSRVLVIGYSYLEDSEDIRNSPSGDFVAILTKQGAYAVIHDPYIDEFRGDLIKMAKGCDAAVLMVKHKEYNGLDLRKLKASLKYPLLIDSRGFFDPKKAMNAGFEYIVLGVGKDLHREKKRG